MLKEKQRKGTKMLTKEDLRQIGELMDERFSKHDERFEKIDERLDKIDERLDKIDERFDKIDERFEKIDERFEKIDERFEKIDERFEKQDARLDGFQKELREQRIWMIGQLKEQNEVMDRRFAEQNLFLNNSLERFRKEMTHMMEKMDEKIDARFHEQQLWLENRYDPYIKEALGYLPTVPKTYKQLDSRTYTAEINILDLQTIARNHEDRIQTIEKRESEVS